MNGDGSGGVARLMRLELGGGDQQAQLQALRRRHRQQMEKLKASGDVAREQVRALREQYREAFQAVLTEEQRAQLEELRAERESQGELRGRFGRRGWKGRSSASGGDGGETGGGPVTATGLNSPAGDAATAGEQTTWDQVKAGEADEQE